VERGSSAGRTLAALATFCLLVGASLLLLLQLCARCGQDNAYLGEVLFGLILILLGVIFGLAWLVAARREGLRGLAAGAVTGVAVGAVIVVIGATRTVVPVALEIVELVLLIAGVVATIIVARRA
jgi:Na+/proline symporter